MKTLTRYDDLIEDVRRFLAGRAQELRAAGVADDAILLDPGIGFAKDPAQNLTLLNRLAELGDLPAPLLVGTSRKSFIGAVLDLGEDQRVEGTIATVVAAVLAGARMVRVHDVEPVVRAVRMTEAIKDARPE
jgi:dihydropteroate synthase